MIERSGDDALGGVKLHKSTDGGNGHAERTQTIHESAAIWTDPANSSHVIIGNDGRRGDQLGMTKTWNFVTTSRSPLLPRQLRHGDAYQHLRRHAGTLQLVRPSAVPRAVGIAGFTGRRCRGATASSRSRIRRLPHRLQRVAGRNMVRIDRVTARRSRSGRSPTR